MTTVEKNHGLFFRLMAIPANGAGGCGERQARPTINSVAVFS